MGRPHSRHDARIRASGASTLGWYSVPPHRPKDHHPMPEFETLHYEARDGIAAITLARPEKRNAMNREMFAEIGDAAGMAKWP